MPCQGSWRLSGPTQAIANWPTKLAKVDNDYDNDDDDYDDNDDNDDDDDDDIVSDL